MAQKILLGFSLVILGIAFWFLSWALAIGYEVQANYFIAALIIILAFLVPLSIIFFAVKYRKTIGIFVVGKKNKFSAVIKVILTGLLKLIKKMLIAICNRLPFAIFVLLYTIFGFWILDYFERLKGVISGGIPHYTQEQVIFLSVFAALLAEISVAFVKTIVRGIRSWQPNIRIQHQKLDFGQLSGYKSSSITVIRWLIDVLVIILVIAAVVWLYNLNLAEVKTGWEFLVAGVAVTAAAIFSFLFLFLKDQDGKKEKGGGRNEK